jgi:hypothetical protein
MKYAKLLGLGMLITALAVMGCGQQKPDTSKAEDKSGGKEEGHPHGPGPNGGVVFDLGKYHAEFTVDHSAKECTILILGDDEKTPTPVAAKEFTLTTKETKTEDGKVVPPMTIKMLPKDGKGSKATKFIGADPGLGNVADFEGTVIGEIGGKPSSGEFKEE